jgi:hypothetical protein
MLGSTEFGNALVHLLKAPIEAWEDTLETNHDDYVYVDGEEGDFGIVQYFGTGSDGKTKQLLLVKYVHGGDVENTYFTEEGALVFQAMLSEKMPHAILAAIQENMNPPDGEKRSYTTVPMRIGEIKKEKDLIAEGRAQYEPLCIAHQPNFHLPEMVGGAVIKWDDLFFTAFVHTDGRIMFWCEYAKEFLRAGDLYQPLETWRERFNNWEVSMVYHPAGLYDLFKRWEAGEIN